MIELDKIYNEDCLEGMKRIPDGSVDAVICDLPYGTTANRWDAVIPFEPLWEQFHRVCKDNAAIVLFAGQPFTSALIMSNPKEFRHEWIWIKNRGSNFANTVREPMKEHEEIVVFSKGGWTYNPQMQKRTGGGEDRVKYDFNFVTQSTNYRKFTRPQNESAPVLMAEVQYRGGCRQVSSYAEASRPIALLGADLYEQRRYHPRRDDRLRHYGGRCNYGASPLHRLRVEQRILRQGSEAHQGRAGSTHAVLILNSQFSILNLKQCQTQEMFT